MSHAPSRARSTKTRSAGAVAAALLLVAPVPSAAAVFDLSWTGQFADFTLDGRFAFDAGAVPPDGVVRAGDFTDFDWSLFDGDGMLIRAFEDDHLSDGFNANYDTATGALLQAGRWDGPEGLNLGDPRGEGLNLWSIAFPLEAPENFNPHLHVTDWMDEFPQYPIRFGNVLSGEGHIDGAFFERTTAQITGDPADGDAFGQPIAVTAVPLPAGAPLLLAGLALLALGRRA
ncbi:MAG: hypothetical protein ACFBWO_15055 [Paracoccaceae bacterium]